MKLLKEIVLFSLSGFLFCSCGGKSGSVSWDHVSVVAERIGDIVVLDPSLLKDTIVIPFSELIENIHVVKLDDREEALVNAGFVTISEKHILIKGGRGRPYKLFDINGTYLTDIGRIGQGPGEYNLVYFHQLDEKNQRVYLLPWRSEQILVFDLNGKVLDPIRLPVQVPKGVFKVQDDKVVVATLPFEGIPNVAWIQSIHGEVLHEIPVGSLSVPRSGGFNNEISSLQNTEAIDLSFWYYPARPDTLYHIDFDGQLLPRFTTRFEGDALLPHSYVEWSDYFLGNTSTIIYTEAGTEGKEPEYYIVDKKTLKGGYIHLQDDVLGKKAGNPLFYFINGYYAINDEPGNIEEMLQKALQSDGLNEKYRKRWMELLNQIDPNDNNYIIYAKMKR